MFWFFSLAGTLMAGIAIAKLINLASQGAGFVGLFYHVVSYYDRFTSFLLDWIIPWLQPQLEYVASLLGISANVGEIWRSVFILSLLPFTAVVRASLLVPNMNVAKRFTVVATAVGGIIMAAIAAILVGMIAPAPEGFYSNFLVAFIPLAGAGFYHTAITQTTKAALSDSQNKLSTHPERFLIEVIGTPILIVVIWWFWPEQWWRPASITQAFQDSGGFWMTILLIVPFWVLGSALGGHLMPNLIAGVAFAGVVAVISALGILFANAVGNWQNTGLVVLLFIFAVTALFRWALGLLMVAASAKQKDEQKAADMRSGGLAVSALGRDTVFAVIGGALFVLVNAGLDITKI